MGLVLVDGYSRFLPYYKSLLDKLYVDYNVWTVGEYKSFVEPITRDDMSPQDEEASKVFLDALWSAYQADVTAARGLAAPALQQYADDIVDAARRRPAAIPRDSRWTTGSSTSCCRATPCASASATRSARAARHGARPTPTPRSSLDDYVTALRTEAAAAACARARSP